METRHIIWNSKTGQVTAWIVQDSEIIQIATEPSDMTRAQIEAFAYDTRANLEII